MRVQSSQASQNLFALQNAPASESSVQPIPIISNLATVGSTFKFSNLVGYTLWLNQFSIAGNGGIPTISLSINNIPWTVTPSGSGTNFVLSPSTFSLVNIFTYSAQYQSQEIALLNTYPIVLTFVSGTGSVDFYFMLFNRSPSSAIAGLSQAGF